MGIDLKGRSVIVTGASRGLGEAIARSFWQRGANLFLTARSEESLSSLKSDLLPSAQKGQSIDVFRVDLMDGQGVETLVNHARNVWKRVDVLINNAAIPGPIGKLWENSWGEWQRTIQVNLLAPVALCRLIVPWMAEFRQGKIINLSGGGAAGPRPNFSAYGTAKCALVRFSEILAHEVRNLNIQVNCIAPGAMNTQMLEAIRHVGAEHAGEKEYHQALQSKDHREIPQKAVDLCCFLASNVSKGITGKLISAVWDPWEDLPSHEEELQDSDIYTLRRIIPLDRQKNWDS